MDFSKIFKDNDQVSNQEDTTTTWVNNTKHTAKFALMTNDFGTDPYNSLFKPYIIKPGEKLVLSSKYDQGIRTTDSTGKVVGGLCPWLLKDDEDEYTKPPMADALDFETDIKLAELENIKKRVAREAAKREALDTIKKEQETVELAMDALNQEQKKPGRPKKAVQE